MRIKMIALITTLFLMFAIVAGCGNTSESKTKLKLATGTTSGVYYPLGNAIAKLWSDKIKNLSVSAQSTNASAQNINLLANKEADVAFSQANVAYYAWNGENEFKGRPQKDNIRAIGYLYPNVSQFVVRADSAIKSLSDFEGKTFVPGAMGSGTEVTTREIFSVYGLDYREKKNVKVDYVGFTETVELIKNKQADGALISAAVPTAAVLDLANSIDIRLLSLEPEKIDAISKQYPWYYQFEIPANTYKGQKDQINSVALANIMLVRADLPDDLVYQLTKTLYENTAELINTHKVAKQIKLEQATTGLAGIKLHPGAEKYLREKGVLK